MNEANLVVAHAKRQEKKGKNPSLCYKGERNPKKALELAVADVAAVNNSLYRSRRTGINNVLSPYFGIGTGHYCPDCGGLCGNDKHTRRW